MSIKTTAGIVNWNSGRHLETCVESLMAAADVEIVVFDNHSTDGSLDMAGTFGARVRVIRSNENRGFAGGVNEILRCSETSYVLILNPDIRVERASVQLMEEFMDSHPRAAAVGGYVGEKYLPRRLPTAWSLIRENLGFPVGAVYDRALFAESGKNAGAQTAPAVDQVAAAAMMVRREVCAGDLMFDTRFFPAWYEDVDFCRRLKNKNWEVYFMPQAKFLHDGGYSAKTMGAGPFLQAYYCNQVRYAQKWFGLAGRSAVRASIALGMLGRMIVRPWNLAGYIKVVFGALIGW